MGKVGDPPRRGVLAAVAVVLGTLMLGVPGIGATNKPPPPKPGTITVIRSRRIPEGDRRSFGFVLRRDAVHALGRRAGVFGDLSSGTYSVSESSTEGWTLTSATCSDGSSPSSIDLSAGEIGAVHVRQHEEHRRLRGRGRSSSRSRRSRKAPRPASTSSSTTRTGSRSRTASRRSSASCLPARTRWRSPRPRAGRCTSATCSDESSAELDRAERGRDRDCTFVNTSNNQPTDRPAVVDQRVEERVARRSSRSRAVRSRTRSRSPTRPLTATSPSPTSPTTGSGISTTRAGTAASTSRSHSHQGRARTVSSRPSSWVPAGPRT